MKKKLARIRRSKSTRVRIEYSELPRLTVHRTNLHMYASIISPDKSKILVSASTLESHMRDQLTGKPGRGGNKKAASLVGEMVGKKAKEKGIKAFIGYGKLAKEMVKGYGERGFFFENEEDLKSYLKKNITSKDVILIKGSRGMKMERFINV